MPGGSPHEELFIDVTAVGTLASTLNTASSDMSAALGILESVGGGDLGSTELNRAAAEFRDRWQYGIARMAKETGGLAEALVEACAAYAAQVEAEVAALSATGTALPDPDAAPATVPASSQLRGDF